MDFKAKAISSAKWNFISQFGSYVLTFGFSVVLARVIEPEEFGLLGMLSIFMAISTLLINSGLSTALIRDKSTTSEDFTTVFYFNIGVSTIIYFCLYTSAPYIAHFYNEPELIRLTRVMCTVLIVNSFALIQNTQLIRDLNFKKQTLVNLTGIGISILSALFLLFYGFGIYSVVGQVLVQGIIVNTMLWFTSDWRPSGAPQIKSLKKMWKFSSNILFTGLFNSIIDNLDNLFIGKVFRPESLGLFMRAKSTKAIPEKIFSGVISTTVFSLLSKLEYESENFKTKHFTFFEIGSYFIIPLAFFISSQSNKIIIGLFGNNWEFSGDYLHVLSFTLIPIFLANIFNQTILCYGDSRIYLKMNILKRTMLILSIPIGIYYGLDFYILVFTFLTICGLLIDILFTSRLLKIPTINYLRTLITPILLSSLIYSINYLLVFNYSNLLDVSIILIIDIVIYLLTLGLIYPKMIFQLMDVTKKMIGK